MRRRRRRRRRRRIMLHYIVTPVYAVVVELIGINDILPNSFQKQRDYRRSSLCGLLRGLTDGLRDGDGSIDTLLPLLGNRQCLNCC